jgi:hypothetical protein
VDEAQLHRRSAYWPLMQDGQTRRRRVMKELNRGRALSAEDIPVAAVLVDQQRSLRIWLVPLCALAAVGSLFSGLREYGSLRWVFFGFFACWLFLVLFLLRGQRRLTRNYERQHIASAKDQRDDDTS